MPKLPTIEELNIELFRAAAGIAKGSEFDRNQRDRIINLFAATAAVPVAVPNE